MKWYEAINENLTKYSYWNHDAENSENLVLNPSDMLALYENAKDEYGDIESFIVDGIRYASFTPIDNVKTWDIYTEEIADMKAELINDLKYFLNEGNFYDYSIVIDEVKSFLDNFNKIEIAETKLDNAHFGF